MRGLVWSVPLLVLGLALVAGACAGNGDEEEVLGPSGTPPSSPAATPISSAASETELREAVTTYMRAIAHPNPDLAALYALESADFRKTCPFDEYVDLITPLLWPELADDCGYDETSRVDFIITGSKIAFTSDRDGNDEVYVMNADSSGLARLTNNPTHDGVPDWSPDGTRIAFTSVRDGNDKVYVINGNGAGGIMEANLSFSNCPKWRGAEHDDAEVR